MSPPLTGIVPPMITPLRARDELDVPGLEGLIEHNLAGSVSGLFIPGTTGEWPSRSYRLRKELIERTCRQVDRRVQVLVGITDTAFQESVNLAHWAADAGADAVVLAPPYYLPEGQPECRGRERQGYCGEPRANAIHDWWQGSERAHRLPPQRSESRLQAVRIG